MSDRVLLQGIQFYGYHGVYEEERRLGSAFSSMWNFAWISRALLGRRRVGGRRLQSGARGRAGDRHAPKVQAAETLRRHRRGHLEQFPIQEVTVRRHKAGARAAGVLAGVSVEVTRP